ncbi:hypothetical protein, partial [Actinocorallia lasiicapitis]
MQQFRLTVSDLAGALFAFSPVEAAVASLRVRAYAGRYPEHLPFVRATAQAYGRLDTELLDRLLGPTRWSPDFVTPRPVAGRTLADELEIILRTPPDTVRTHFLDAYHGHPVPPVLSGPVGPLLERIVAALAAYWEACIAPWWPRIEAVLEGDVIHRARELARGGSAAMLEGLGPNVAWDDSGTLTLTYPFEVPSLDAEVARRGLVLSPSCFVRQAVSTVSEGELPVVIYPARGRATVWDSAPPPAPA